MNLVIFLSFKESMEIMKRVGQDCRFIDYYLKPYSQSFEKIYVFSWKKESYNFPFKNVELVPNLKNTNVYLYNLLLPFFHKKIIEKSDVIRLMQFTAIVPALIAKMFFHLKIIATYGFAYGQTFKIKGSIIKYLAWNLVEIFSLKFVDHFIVTYQKMFDFLVGKGVSPQKVTLTPNGVDIDAFRPGPSKTKKKGEKTNLLFVGRMEVEKNIINLARAISLLKNEKIRFTLIGKGALQKEVEKILSQSGREYRIVPPLPHRQLIERYRQADIFILPSYAEGYPKALIEAMACGLPSVVGRYPGHEQIITDGENGLVCDFNPKSISEKINLLIKDKRLGKKISQNARTFVQTNNDIKKILNKEIKLIRSVYEDR